MRCRMFVVALGALWSSQVSATDLGSVYVAPGGVYIASAHVDVRPETGDQAYSPPGRMYYAPRHVREYRAPEYYESTRSMYRAQHAYVDRWSDYSAGYDTEYVPRPPARVPYEGRGRCVTDPAYGPSVYCD